MFRTFPLPPNSATNLPPGFSARATPWITRSASGIQCKAALENTAPNSFENCKVRASQTSNRRCGNFLHASAIISGERSTPSNSAPLAASSAVSAPVPHPRSKMRSPALAASKSTRPLAFSQTNVCLASSNPASHVELIENASRNFPPIASSGGTSVCRIAGKFKIRKPDSIDGNLICANCGWRFESRGARTSYKVVLIDAIAADAETTDQDAIFIQDDASGEEN